MKLNRRHASVIVGSKDTMMEAGRVLSKLFNFDKPDDRQFYNDKPDELLIFDRIEFHFSMIRRYQREIRQLTLRILQLITVASMEEELEKTILNLESCSQNLSVETAILDTLIDLWQLQEY